MNIDSGYIALGIFIFDIILLLFIISEDREPSAAAFWMFLIFAFPILGPIIFFFFGRDWRKGTRKTRAEAKKVEQATKRFMPKVYVKYQSFHNKFMKQHKGTFIGRIALLGLNNSYTPVMPCDTYKILPTGESGFDSLKMDLRAAKKSIHMQFFIWEYDKLTKELMEILLDRLAHKVEVRISYDFMGSVAFKKKEVKTLRKAGAKMVPDVIEINKFNYRNHRKIAVIDGLIGYTGGINIGQEYIDGGKNYPHWRDTFVRVTGPIVLELQKLIAMRWLIIGKENLFQKKYFPDMTISRNAIPSQSNFSSSEYYWSTARDAYLEMIMNAKEKVYIQSPYFIPDQALYGALETAALSGVDIRLLMTGWPDKKSVWRAAQSFFERLLNAGMKIYYYDKGFMHAKTMLVDDQLVSIGSTNFDVRSFNLQRENGIFFYDKGIAKEHLKVITNDFKNCKEFTIKDYNKFTRFYKFQNSLYRLFSNLF